MENTEDSNRSLIKRIEEIRLDIQEKEEETVISLSKYLVISINDKKYALYAEDVREIIGSCPVFYVPFTPPYVKGFINRHGEPYTAIDLTVIFEGEKLDSSSYIVLNRENDQLAILISEVLEIARIPDTDLRKITSTETEQDYFLGTISIDDKDEIFLLNLESIVNRLESDINEY